MSTHLRRQFASLFLIVMCFMTMIGVARAATTPPNIVSYQGRLLNANGVPVTSVSVSVIFKLYDASSGGNCLWSNSSSSCASSTARTVTLSSGLFSENLGDTTLGAPYAAIPSTVFGDYATVYLGITIGSDSEMTPRKRMTAAPYALNAQLLDGIDSTSFLQTGAAISGASPLVFEGATDDAFETTFTITDPTADNTITFKNASGTVAFTSDITSISADSLDFTDFADALSLDAATSITGTAGETFQFTRTLTNATSENGLYLTVTAQDSTSSTTAQYGLLLDNAASTEGLDGGLVLQNTDADDAVGAGILFAAGGDGTDFTYGIDFTAASYGTAAIRLGGNVISGTTASINFTGYTVAATTGATVIAGLAEGTSALTLTAGDVRLTDGDLVITAGDIDAAGFDVAVTTGATVIAGSADGTDALTLTLGDILISNGDFDLSGGDFNVTLDAGDSASITATSSSVFGTALSLSQTSTANGASGLFTSVTQSDGATAGNKLYGSYIRMTGNDADGDMYGLFIEGLASTNAGAGTYEIGIMVDNKEETVGSMPDGIMVMSSGASGGVTDAIDVSDPNIVNGLNFGINVLLGTTGDIDMTNFDVIGSSGNMTTAGDIAVNGGDLMTTAVTASLFDTVATTVNLASAASLLNIADSSVSATIDIGGVTNSAQNIINIATNASLLDTISIGNSAAGTTTTVSGGTVNVGNTASTKSIYIGGSSVSGTDTVAISTNGTLADSITIGNTHASTTTSVTGGTLQLGAGGASPVVLTLGNPHASSTTAIYGGPNWEISTAGLIVMGANLESTAATINLFDDLYTDDSTIDFGGVTVDSANTINIATEGTTADTITIGNTHASTALALKGGTVALTAAATTGTTSTSAFTLNDTALTTGTLLYGDMRGTSGTAVNFAYGGAVTQATSAFIGHAINLSNLTGANGLDMTNLALTTKGQTRSGLGTEDVSGLTIASSAALTQDTAAGTFSWHGVHTTAPAITANFPGALVRTSAYKATLAAVTSTAGSAFSSGYAVSVPDSAIVTGGFMNALDIYGTGTLGVITTGPAAGTLNALKIGTITTPGAGTENGISVGTGWDNAISGTTAGTNLISFTNFTVATGGNTTVGGNIFTTLDNEGDRDFALCVAVDDGGAIPGTTPQEIDDCDTAANADYAERYPSASNVTYGDIVVPGERVVFTEDASVGRQEIRQAILSSFTYQGPVIGIVSNNHGDFTSAGNNVPEEENPMPIALVGRVPVNVTNEGGAIRVGDFVTTSSTPGKGMKATKAGRVIGMALANFDGVSGQVMVQVINSWYFGDLIGTDGTSSMMTNNVIVAPVGTASASTTSFDSYGLALRGSAWDGNQAQTVSMMFQNKITDGSNYRLSVRNTTDSEVAYITNAGTMQVAGDMVVGGKIYPSNLGSIQTDKYIYYDGSAGPGGDFMRTNASGWSTGSYDFAEMFPSSEMLVSGDVVVFSSTNEHVKRSTKKNERSIAGIVSTRPGFLAGENTPGSYPIALAGRVPTNVNLENGAIAVGDPLTTSSVEGSAMKATNAGPIVGYALEPFDGTQGKIVVFVAAGYWGGEATSSTPGADNRASLFGSSNSESMTTLSMGGTINMNGNEISNIGRLAGLTNAWSIEMDGTIKTEGLLKTVITGYNNQKVETAAVTSPEAVITLSGSSILKDGQAEVRYMEINPDFGNVISAIAPVRVVATPNGPVSLYVSEKDQNHFVVKSFGGNASDVAFDWVVTGYRKGFEPIEKTTTPVGTEAPESTTSASVSSDTTVPAAVAVTDVQAPATTSASSSEAESTSTTQTTTTASVSDDSASSTSSSTTSVDPSETNESASAPTSSP